MLFSASGIHGVLKKFFELYLKTNEKKCSHLITKDGLGHGQLDASGLKHFHIQQKLWEAKHSLHRNTMI
jgi:hypothetical protein